MGLTRLTGLAASIKETGPVALAAQVVQNERLKMPSGSLSVVVCNYLIGPASPVFPEPEQAAESLSLPAKVNALECTTQEPESDTASVVSVGRQAKGNVSRLRLLPLVAAVSPLLTFAVTYGITVLDSRDRYSPLLPYISHTGNMEPASGVFTLGICLSVMLTLPVILLQHYRLKSCIATVFNPHIQTHYPNQRGGPHETMHKHCLKLWCDWYNRVGLLFGVLSCLGILLVGCFQEDKIYTVHMLGASLAFVAANTYMAMMVRILYAIRYHYCRRRLFVFRVCAMLTSSLCMVTMISLMMVHKSRYYSAKTSNDEYRRLLFDQKHEGFLLFLFSSISEWIMAACVFTYIMSYYWDFKYLHVGVAIDVRKIPGISKAALAPADYDDENDCGDDGDDKDGSVNDQHRKAAGASGAAPRATSEL